MDGDGQEAQGVAATSGGRACDACRARKVRCDKASPCSNCRACKIACRFSPKVNEHRQRILISNRYEEKVESIDERLKGIEDSLKELMAETRRIRRGKSVDGESSAITSKTTLQPLPVDSSIPDSDDTFEGDTSLLAHSLYAKGLFEKLRSRFPTAHATKLDEVLASLQSTVKSQSDPTTFNDLSSTSNRQTAETGGSSELEMPPKEEVLDLLQRIDDREPRMFLEMPLIEKSHFIEKCRRFYSKPTNYSPAVFVIINGYLYYLFSEQTLTLQKDEGAEARHYASICRSNLDLALEKLPFFMGPSLEACQALAFGAFYAAEFAKPSICLRLTTIAAQMCQSLGYHRIPASEAETKQLRAKKLLFWGVYSLDKGLSLRLGRTSIIQDCDISTTFLACPGNPLYHSWHDISQGWVEFARFQGRVFSELFTVAALSTSQTTRANMARKLAAELQEWHQKQPKVGSSDMLYPEDFQMTVDSIDIVYFSVLTIIYRAVPPSPGANSPYFYQECITSARKALECHQAVALRFKGSEDIWQVYIYWTLLYSPFAPFMVVFSEAIAALNFVDLQKLAAFVASINPTDGASKAAVGLFDLCSAFYEVARVYLSESFSSAQEAGPSAIMNNPDGSQIVSQGGSAQITTAIEVQMPMESFSSSSKAVDFGHTLGNDSFMAWAAEDWFLPDQYMMELLDPDFRL